MVLGGTGQDGSNITDQYEDPVGAQSLKQNYGDDSRSEVIVDGNDNIFVASCTRSSGPAASGGFPTQNGFQPLSAGKQDGVVLKINAACNALLWSTLIGGTGDDAAYVLDISPVTGQLFVAGGTGSTDNFPGNHQGGVVQPNGPMAGAIDGFIAWLQDNGTSVNLVKSTYIGTGAIDQIYGLQFDKLGFPYITGTTLSSAWPHINTTFNVGGAKQFVCKLQPDLSAYVYSMTWGTASSAAGPNISPVAFLVDRCENVYVSGWGGIVDHGNAYPSSGTAGLPVSAGAAQTTTDGSDFYFFVMAKNATSQLYGSFFGQKGGNFQEHVDGGTIPVSTKRGDLSGDLRQLLWRRCVPHQTGQCLCTWSTEPLRPGSTTPSIGGCNEAGVKIEFNLAGVGSGVKASITGENQFQPGVYSAPRQFYGYDRKCGHLCLEFRGRLGRTDDHGAHHNHTYTGVGVYKVMLISVDPNSCNGQDTSYTVIRAADDSAHLAFTEVKIPPCTDLGYLFTNTSTTAGSAILHQYLIYLELRRYQCPGPGGHATADPPLRFPRCLYRTIDADGHQLL